jgi:hypothetical protein
VRDLLSKRDLRGAQSKLAKLRTSVAQQTGLPDEQRPTWRSSTGAAKVMAARERMAVMVNCMLKVGWLFLGKNKKVLVESGEWDEELLM